MVDRPDHLDPEHYPDTYEKLATWFDRTTVMTELTRDAHECVTELLNATANARRPLDCGLYARSALFKLRALTGRLEGVLAREEFGQNDR